MEDIRQGRRRSTDRKEDEEMDGTRCLGILDDDTFSSLLHNGGLECRDNGLIKKRSSNPSVSGLNTPRT